MQTCNMIWKMWKTWYERCLFSQLNNYFDTGLGLRKGFSVVNCLLPIIEKWTESFDQYGASGTLLTDLSQAFDSLLHDLIIVKVDADILDISSLRFVYCYLSSGKQRVKINDMYSFWSNILSGVPHGSILDPMLINIFICNLFLFVSNSNNCKLYWWQHLTQLKERWCIY